MVDYARELLEDVIEAGAMVKNSILGVNRKKYRL
jgi:hypothetical protein